MHNPIRIPSLDGWRAIAIAMVLVAHFGTMGNQNFDIGRQGVGIFFVLSGFLITTNLLRERAASGRLDLRSFYVRRFFRLMPCAWGLLAVTLLFGVMDFRELASCVFFYRNFLTHPHTLVTSHFWSLSIEEQFYLAWPWALVFLSPRRARYVAVALAGAIAVYRFSVPHAIFAAENQWTQFRADGLLIGCAFALTPKLPKMRPALFWISAVVVGCCVHFFPVLPPFGESILIGWMIHTTAQGGIPVAQKVLNWKPIAKIGVMSYSLYVWQTPLTGMPHRTFLGLAVVLAALAAITAFSFYCLEKPFTRLGRRIAEKLEQPQKAPAIADQGSSLAY